MPSINLSFTINLSNFILHSVIKHEPHRLHDSYILMTVKDNSFIGGGIFLGEALLKLEDIPLSQIDQNLSELPQIQLPLTKPSCHGMMGRTIFQFDIYSIKCKCENVKPGIFMILFSFQIRISCQHLIRELLIDWQRIFFIKKNGSCKHLFFKPL